MNIQELEMILKFLLFFNIFVFFARILNILQFIKPDIIYVCQINQKNGDIIRKLIPKLYIEFKKNIWKKNKIEYDMQFTDRSYYGSKYYEFNEGDIKPILKSNSDEILSYITEQRKNIDTANLWTKKKSLLEKIIEVGMPFAVGVLVGILIEIARTKSAAA